MTAAPRHDDPAARAELARRVREVALLEGRFTLRSGQVSDRYFDKYQFEAQPRLLARIAELMAPLIPPGTDVLAGLELGGIPLVTALSQHTGLPAAFLRKRAKTYGTARYAEGAPLADRSVVLVEDVVSSGGAIIDQLRMLRADGIEPGAALCVIDRQSGGAQALAAEGLPLMALLRMDEILDPANS